LLEIKEEKVVGAYPSFFQEASRRSGVSIDYRIVPWSRAVKEAEGSENLMLFPFTRTAARENRFTWITPLKEDPICFASVEAQIDSLDDARKLKRVLVWRGTSHQAFLEKQGFTNLILVGNVKKVLQIFNASPDAAWYTVCDQAQLFFTAEGAGISAKIGTPVVNEAIWLAGGKSFVPPRGLKKFVQTIDALRGEKLLDKLLAEAAE
jgi:polar amino acid transport system substrate-binding protein